MYTLEKISESAVRSSMLDDYSGMTTGRSGSGFSSFTAPSFNGVQPGVLIAVAIISLIAAILLFVLLIQKKKAPRGRFMKWLREYLNFRSILVSGIIKFVYAFFAVFLTIMSFVVMFQGRDDSVLPMIISGLVMLVVGNILLRVMLELTMALIVVWENTSDIRSVIVKKEEMPEEKKPKEKEPVKEEVLIAEVEEPVVVQPVEPVEPVEPVPPVEPAQPVEPVQPAEPVEPQQPPVTQ